jgi:hypothetical protein
MNSILRQFKISERPGQASNSSIWIMFGDELTTAMERST